MSALSHLDWVKLAERIEPAREAFIDGASRPAESGETFADVNPATGRVIADVAACGGPDVDRAVRAARRSYDTGSWSRASHTERKAVLLRFADLLERHSDELALLDSLDMGKRVADAADLDLPFSVSLFRYYAEALDKVAGEVAPTPPGSLALVRRAPLGVVGAVIPWNYPVDMLAWKVAPALAAGNSVVLKPAEQSPLSALRIAQLAAEAGLPDGVLNVVPGPGETAGNLLSNDDVPAAMIDAFEAHPDDHLAARLLAALQAGDAAGGEEGPVHSCGLLVVDKVSWPTTDLRVDWSESPLLDLARLWAIWGPQEADYVRRALDPAGAPSYRVPGDE